MKKIIFISLITIFLFAGCNENINKDGQEVLRGNLWDVKCYEGLLVVKAGGGKYSNGYFYKRDKNNGELIKCSSNIVK